jgi:hypothetical protein
MKHFSIFIKLTISHFTKRESPANFTYRFADVYIRFLSIFPCFFFLVCRHEILMFFFIFFLEDKILRVNDSQVSTFFVFIFVSSLNHAYESTTSMQLLNTTIPREKCHDCISSFHWEKITCLYLAGLSSSIDSAYLNGSHKNSWEYFINVIYS